MKSLEIYEERLQKEEENKKYKNKEDPTDPNGLKLYEGMLIQAEKKIREHIRVRISIKIIFNIFIE